MPNSPRGALIVIEGLDRAGKSTQCERLCKRLEQQGLPVRALKFPSRLLPHQYNKRTQHLTRVESDRSTAIGSCIDAYLRKESGLEDHSIHLLFSANRWEAAASIRADVEDGITLVVDRYYHSGIVYSAVKPHADISLEWAREPDVGLPRPDICVFLDVEPEIAAKRGGFGEERYEARDMQKRVRAGFLALMKKEDSEDITMVDAGGDLDEVESKIWHAIQPSLLTVGNGEPLRTVSPWHKGKGEA